MQLDSLLRSVKDHCTGIDWVTVIWRSSSDLHFAAYQQVAEGSGLGARLCMYPQHGTALGDALGCEVGCPSTNAFLPDTPVRADHIALAVDDQLFYRPSDFKLAAATLDEHNGFVWSWRLGYDPEFTEECPCLVSLREHWLTTSFTASPDYSYLFHSDGALYKTANYTHMLDRFLLDWRTGKYTPNDLEAAVAGKRSRWAVSTGPHLGPMKPTCITWQLNRVQTRYGSPAAEIEQTRLNYLALAYLDGRRVDNEKLYEMLRADAQRFNPPGARPTHVYASEEASKFWASAIR